MGIIKRKGKSAKYRVIEEQKWRAGVIGLLRWRTQVLCQGGQLEWKGMDAFREVSDGLRRIIEPCYSNTLYLPLYIRLLSIINLIDCSVLLSFLSFFCTAIYLVDWSGRGTHSFCAFQASYTSYMFDRRVTFETIFGTTSVDSTRKTQCNSRSG